MCIRDRLKEILILDYGRQNNFNLIVNGQPLDVENIKGESFSETYTIPGVCLLYTSRCV